MSLLDAAKKEARNYISPKDFLCFLSYKLEEPIEDVVSFLLYNHFDELVCEYYLDNHYRIYNYDDIGCKYKTSKLFDEIAKDGFFYYISFCIKFYDDCLDSDNPDLHYYEPIEIDFYYSLEELQQIDFIKALNLPLEKCKTLDYTVTSDDMVTAKTTKDNVRLFKLINTNIISNAERAKQEQDIIDEHGENSQAHNLYKVIEIASKGEIKAQQQDVVKTDEQIISELKECIERLTNNNDSLKEQLEQKETAAADDKELRPNSEAKVAKLVYTLLTELKYELTIGGKGNTNLLIENTSKNLNTPLSPNFIADWLKKAYQLQIKDL